MALETTGGMSKECATAIKELRLAAGHLAQWAPSELILGLKVELSVIVQKWVARIVLSGLAKARRLPVV